MFSLPDSSGWNPEPISSSDAILPTLVIDPLSGWRISARHLRRVDLPDPFRPMSPKVDPRGTVNDTSCSAQKSS
jgi:hypothetical protein